MKKQRNQIKTGILLGYINMGLGNLIPVLYTPIMLSILGQAEYGLYKLSNSVISYLSLISMGIGSAVTRYLIKANTENGKKAEEEVLGLFVLIFKVIAILSFFAGFTIMIFIPTIYGQSLTAEEISKMKVLVFIMTCNTSLSFSISPYMSVVTAHEKFLFYQGLNILSTCVVPLLNLAVLFAGYASIGMAITSLSVNIIVRFAYLVYIRKVMDIRANLKQIPRHLIKEILGFSFWIFVSNVVGQLYNATDTVMIGSIPSLATQGVAIYAIGMTFNSIIGGLSSGISSLIAPMTNKMVFSKCSNSELTNLAIKVGRIQGIIFMLVMSGFIAFGVPFIDFYAGKIYRDAYWITILTTAPCFPFIVQSVCLNTVVAQNKHKFRSIVYLLIAILNVIGTWFLMQTKLGIIGAALMTGIATIIGQGFVMNWYYACKTGFEIRRFWKSMVPIIIWPLLQCIVTLSVEKWIYYKSMIYLLIGIVCYTIVYCIMAWFLMLNVSEKQMILKFIPIRGQ